MKVFSKVAITLLLAFCTTGVLWAQNSEAKIATKTETADYSKEIIGGQNIPDSEVIAVGTPMSKEQIKSLNIPTQTSNSKETDAVDIIGGTSLAFNAGPRTRGNAFYCTEDKTLVEFMNWLNVASDPTQMWMCIYEGSAAIGTYTLVSANDVSPAPVGLGWVSSGVIDFPLEAGKYYMIVASFEQACGYYSGDNISPFPYPVAFGEAIGGVGHSWTPQTELPPQTTMSPTAGAWDEAVLYHQQLVTENPITEDNDLGIEAIIAPVSGVSLSASEAVTVTIKNYGFEAQSGFEVSYTMNGGTAVVETISATINSGETLDHTFATTEDLSVFGSYVFEACTDLTGDVNPDNDCLTETVECLPPSYCEASTTNGDEWIANVLCGTIDNASVWQNGVADYTDLSTTIGAGMSENITILGGTPNANNNVYVWVDWNNDFEFEIGGDEEFTLTFEGTTGEFSGTITVPAGTSLGDCRMRVRMNYFTTPEPCGNSAYGEIEDYTITVEAPTYGTLNGTVTADGGAAIQGATITLASATTTSAADGTYSFTAVYTGTQTVTCSADGYIPETETITIEEGQTTTKDFTLGEANYGNLEGTVTAEGGAAIEGATISIAGATATSGSDGSYSITDILVGTYSVSCTATNYDPISESVTIEEGQTADLNFELIESGSLTPPVGFTAEVMNGNDVDLHWVAPGGIGSILWGDGTNTGNGIGLTNGGVFRVASRWSLANLEPYAGKTMSSITIFPKDDANAIFTLKVWVGENAAFEIISQEVTSFNVNEFNEIPLTTPFVIDDSKELWFGYEVSHAGGTLPAGCDDGPAVANYGDLISTNGTTWISMSTTWGMDYNFNIAGYIVESDGSGKKSNTPMVKSTISNPSTGNQLVASGSNGTLAKMDMKAEKSFLGYNVYRDGALIAEQIAETSYSDMDLTAGTYSYDVKAVYDAGTSVGGGPIEISILNGVDRGLVVVEVATGTWCQYCPGAAMGVDDMYEEGLSVGVIEYHTGDSYESTETAARINYYNVSGYPTAQFDGIITSSGGNASQSLYAAYLPEYETRISIPCQFAMDAEYYNTGDNNYQISIDAEMIAEYAGLDNDLVLQVALTESHIPESWQTQSELNFVCRDMVPNENGTALDFAQNAQQSVLLDFSIPASYDMQNIALIVFIQDNDTKEILQSSAAMLTTGVEKIANENRIEIFPNPATDHINVSASEDILSISVFNGVGQLVSVNETDNNFFTLNTENLKSGLYFIKVETEKGTVSKRVVIK